MIVLWIHWKRENCLKKAWKYFPTCCKISIWSCKCWIWPRWYLTVLIRTFCIFSILSSLFRITSSMHKISLIFEKNIKRKIILGRKVRSTFLFEFRFGYDFIVNVDWISKYNALLGSVQFSGGHRLTPRRQLGITSVPN